MKIEYRKLLLIVLLLLTFVFLLCGCGFPQSSQDDGITLWVITEQSCSDGMNLQAEMIAERIEEAYDNLTIQLDILPTDAEEREFELKQLRAQIMAGKGPDVYLLPTGSQLKLDYSFSVGLRKSEYIQITPLFSDVKQAIRNGIFANIQTFYNDDSELGTDALKTEIMDAGTLDGARYVLPLRFNIPVLLTTPEDWAENGLNSELLNSSVTTLVDIALAREDTAMLTGIRLPDDLSLLSRHFDYENMKMLLTAEEIADYMRSYQAWSAVTIESTQALTQKWNDITFYPLLTDPLSTDKEQLRAIFYPNYNIGNFNNTRNYIVNYMYWRTAGLPLFTSPLANTLNTLSIAKHAEFEAVMYPLRAADGSVTASITYFGAVGCSSKHPELAYEFLRQFLTEEFQWDIYRPQIQKNKSIMNWDRETQSDGQIEDSWPVRTVGSVPYLWATRKYQCKGIASSWHNASKLVTKQMQQIELTDADLPALTWEIDEVRFPVILDEEESIEYALSQLNEEDGTPTDADIGKLAQQVYQNLWYHLYEG